MRVARRSRALRPAPTSVSQQIASLAIFVALASAGCSDSGENDGSISRPEDATPAPAARPPAADELDALYARDHLVEVVVELDPGDWETLRAEGRPLSDGFLGSDEDFVFSEYVGAASVDGQRYENVVIRKKGYLGSLSRPRPSLKLDFGEVEDAGSTGRVFERLTLNNNRQDHSRARTCLAYDVFARAGVPAPRCNLAHVVVNGEDLGTYSNVEPVKKPMLSRHFGVASGALYEGQLVDFVADDIPRFQLKTNQQTDERNNLQRLASTLEATDPELPARLEEILDLPRFREFWAAETLVGHWDGYTGNRNNFYIYDNPASGRFEFIPWGTDGAFADSIPGETQNTSAIVYANGLVANRLYRIPVERTRFRSRLAALTDSVWNEAALSAELERITALAPDALPGATAELAKYIQGRGRLVRAELRSKPAEWVDPEPNPCSGSLSDVTFEFETDFGSLNPDDLGPGLGAFTVDASADALPRGLDDSAWFGRAGVEAPSKDSAILIRAVSVLRDGRVVVLQVTVPPEEFSPGRRTLHGFETAGVIVISEETYYRLIGFIAEGTLELDAASAVAGAPVEGRLDGKLIQLGCAGEE